MKRFRRYFCVLLCCVLSLGVFSVSVSAEELETKPYHIYQNTYIVYGSYWVSIDSLNFNPSNGTEEKKENWVTLNGNNWTANNGNVFLNTAWKVANDNQTPLFVGGIKTTVKLQNVYYRYLIMCTSCDTTQYFATPINATAKVYYVDGSTKDLSLDYKLSSPKLDLSLTFTPTQDVQSIEFTFRSSIPADSHISHASSCKVSAYFGEYSGDDKYNLIVVQPSEEAGLLSGIWDSLTSGFNALGEKLTNVWNSITEGFANMANLLSDVWNAIKELPSKIWSLIEQGLTNLFVPTDESMEEYKSKFESMLEEKYGAVWEVVQITFGSWENINASDLKNTITVPKVEIPLPDDSSFSFGGKEVQVIPDGFETIADICKMMSGAFCTLMFINGLRKRYDEVMAVEK